MIMLAKEKNYRFVEFMLGTGLGLGYLTSFRFMGPIGVPEILVACSLLLLILRKPSAILSYSSKIEICLKLYLMLSTYLILPLVTLLIILLSNYSKGSMPVYIPSFMIGISLMFYLSNYIKSNEIDMRFLVLCFAFAFIISNIVAILLGFNVGAEAGRFRGGAKNPNQLTFYAATLSLLLLVYAKKFAIIALPIVVAIVLQAESDAYAFALFLILFSYFIFRAFNSKSIKLNFHQRQGLLFISLILLIITTSLNFSNEIAEIWLTADEGDGRRSLMLNALLATLKSPMVGLGAGSFSGVNSPFENYEAHNTFLDFSVQFGFLYPIVLYGIMIGALYNSLQKREFLISAFLVGFLEAGLFHFSGRHFTFWIEMAVLWTYAFPKKFNYNLKQ